MTIAEIIAARIKICTAFATEGVSRNELDLAREYFREAAVLCDDLFHAREQERRDEDAEHEAGMAEAEANARWHAACDADLDDRDRGW